MDIIIVFDGGFSARIKSLVYAFSLYNPTEFKFIIYDIDYNLDILKSNELVPFCKLINFDFKKEKIPLDFKKKYNEQKAKNTKFIYNNNMVILNTFTFSDNKLFFNLTKIKTYLTIDNYILNKLKRVRTFDNVIFIRSRTGTFNSDFNSFNINSINGNKQYFLIAEKFKDSIKFKNFTNIIRGVSFKFSEEYFNKYHSIDLIINNKYKQSIRKYYEKTFNDLYILTNAKEILDNCNKDSRFLFEGVLIFKILIRNNI